MAESTDRFKGTKAAYKKYVDAFPKQNFKEVTEAFNKEKEGEVKDSEFVKAEADAKAKAEKDAAEKAAADAKAKAEKDEAEKAAAEKLAAEKAAAEKAAAAEVIQSRKVTLEKNKNEADVNEYLSFLDMLFLKSDFKGINDTKKYTDLLEKYQIDALSFNKLNLVPNSTFDV